MIHAIFRKLGLEVAEIKLSPSLSAKNGALRRSLEIPGLRKVRGTRLNGTLV